MEQLHRRFTVDRVKVLLHGYCQGTLKRAESYEMLELGKPRFFGWLHHYRSNPQALRLVYAREIPAPLSASTEHTIATDLRRKQKRGEDPLLPISDCNYSALCDRLEQKGI